MTKPDATQILRLIDDPNVAFVQLRLEKEASIKELVQALRSSATPRQKQILTYVLGLRHAKSAVPFIIKCLDDPSSKVRSNAAEALGKIEDARAGHDLYMHFLTEDDSGVKSNLALGLGGAKYHSAIPALIDALKDSNRWVRNMAAWSIDYIGTKETVKDLQVALEKESNDHTKALIQKLIEDISNRGV
jgi:HEAT repeat protein